MRYTISDCRLADLRAIAPRLRDEDLQEAMSTGLPVVRFLNSLWQNSAPYRRAGYIDGEIAAVWGAVGGAIDPDVDGWLFTATIIEKMPLAFFREAQREVHALLDIHRTITTGVSATYSRSLRFWQMMGFSRTGDYRINGVEFVRLTMGHA